MTHDQALMKQLQQHLPGWTDRTITFDRPSYSGGHWSLVDDIYDSDEEPRCVFDPQGRLIELHLCYLKLSQFPSDVWRFSSLQRLNLSNNGFSNLPPELGRLTAL